MITGNKMCTFRVTDERNNYGDKLAWKKKKTALNRNLKIILTCGRVKRNLSWFKTTLSRTQARPGNNSHPVDTLDILIVNPVASVHRPPIICKHYKQTVSSSSTVLFGLQGGRGVFQKRCDFLRCTKHESSNGSSFSSRNVHEVFQMFRTKDVSNLARQLLRSCDLWLYDRTNQRLLKRKRPSPRFSCENSEILPASKQWQLQRGNYNDCIFIRTYPHFCIKDRRKKLFFYSWLVWKHWSVSQPTTGWWCVFSLAPVGTFVLRPTGSSGSE